MKRGWWILLGVMIAAFLLLIAMIYKALGELGNAFIITVVFLAIICALAEELSFRSQGLFLKIARKIGLKLKRTKGGPNVRH